MNNKKNYYIGLDIGTDSVGYAAAHEDYSLLKFSGEPVWGTTVFDSASQSDSRRTFRSARRRLDRRQQRVHLIQELFAPEISVSDPHFYTRIAESKLHQEDKTYKKYKNVYFTEKDYNDRHYYKQYPTIHHLIKELMISKEKHDVRLVYIACAWLVAHRGHFFSEVSKENIDEVKNFEPVYNNLMNWFKDNEIPIPWECDVSSFSEIMKLNKGITSKEKDFTKLLYNGKKPKKDIEYPIDRALLIKLLSGGKCKLSDLFNKEEYTHLESISLGMEDEKLAAALMEIGDDEGLILCLKALYDWSLLIDILKGKESISEAKVYEYEQHKEDLKNLKKFIRKYLGKNKYNEIFRTSSSSHDNYVAYSGHESYTHMISQEKFCDYIKKIVRNIEPKKADEKFYNDMMARLENYTFMPKQVDSDNRVIPYQLYWYELNEILKNASSYLPFLNVKDEDGITVSEKILSVFEFRVPYFVGPLVSENKSKFAWMKRKAEGKIYPWNFDKMVDLDGSEQEFINRMTNTCTYLSGEDVLPKSSLLYTKFEVLNEINNIKINEQPISVEDKQKIYDFFLARPRITPKNLTEFLISNNIAANKEEISGIDINGTINSSLKSHIDFHRLLESCTLTWEDVEYIIKQSTCSEDRYRFRKWLENNYPQLDNNNRKYVSSLKHKEFGRLSEKLLNGIYGVCKTTGETATIIDFMWSTNDNLMQILSDKYTFKDEIEKLKKVYYDEHGHSMKDILEEMYISNAVKRPVYRTMDIVKDVVSAIGYPPEKIFIEMARGADENQKGRTVTRKNSILALYEQLKNDPAAAECKNLLENMDEADNKLQSDAIYLYFMQLGKCMYTGNPIDFDHIKTKSYDIDHIWPQSYVKDDSILNNKVLVLSEANGAKGDKYPIEPSIQQKMSGFWKMLRDNKLITEEKYKRLTRITGFTNEEKMGFINRQLVGTRQSTKAVAALLKEKYPDAEIVYPKARLTSDFRQEFDMLKCRSVNDLHHAKDAYLNIVVGNVYDERFSKKWFTLDETYSLKTKNIFKYPFERNGRLIWNGEESLAKVRKIMSKNNIHFTRFAFCRKSGQSGGFFDQNPLKAAEGLVELKNGLSTEKYGGYNGTTASFFVLVKYTAGKKTDMMIMPVELLYSKKFLKDDSFAIEYAKKIIGKDKITNISFPLGKRILKINTVFSIDGFKVALGSKKSGGSQVGLIPLMPMILSYNHEKYIKSLERFSEKSKDNAAIILNEKHDGITKEKNLELYNVLKEKASNKPFNLMPGIPSEAIINGEEKFIECTLAEQVQTLINIVQVFKTGRTGTVDLKNIKGSANSATVILSSTISNWAKRYSDVRIIDMSASGLREKTSDNILELI